jgi:hypothetical protein
MNDENPYRSPAAVTVVETEPLQRLHHDLMWRRILVVACFSIAAILSLGVVTITLVPVHHPAWHAALWALTCLGSAAVGFALMGSGILFDRRKITIAGLVALLPLLGSMIIGLASELPGGVPSLGMPEAPAAIRVSSRPEDLRVQAQASRCRTRRVSPRGAGICGVWRRLRR